MSAPDILDCDALPTEQAYLASLGLADAGLSDNANLVLSTPLVPLEQTFRLQSNPGASKTIYLDFNGHTTTGTSWNNSTMGSSFVSPAYSTDGDPTTFSSSELTLIQRAWQRVAADFAGFDVNVTTEAPPTDWLIKSSAVDPTYGIRVVITSFGPSSSTAGGIAYINSFNWDTDTPCFVYNTSLLGVSEAVSHEVGHTLGLAHDGTFDGTTTVSYYQGHGSGETGWAPIMGVGYYKSVTTWDNGTYYISNNGSSSANYNKGPDDLALITSNNGFSYLSDLEGSSLAEAMPLSLNAGAASQFGTIQTASDSDWFRFDLLDGGSFNLSFNPYIYSGFVDADGLWGGDVTPYFAAVSDTNTNTIWVENGANLDLSVDLFDGSGGLLASSNPTGLAASLAMANLAAGTYYLKLDGVGFGNPTVSSPTGYSDVASIGSYLISGSITNADPTPVITLAVNALGVEEDSGRNLVFSFTRSSASADPLPVSYSIGGTAGNGIDYAAIPTSVTFAGGSRTATVVVTPIGDTSQEADKTVLLTLQPGGGYRIGTTAAVGGSILDDDAPLITAALNLSSVAENSGTPLVLTLTRSIVTSSTLAVDVHLGGTTTITSDYSLGSGVSGTGSVRTLTFAAGSATTSLTLTPINDTLYEQSETLELTLAGRSTYRVGTSSTLVAAITPDGDLPAISLTVSPASVLENGTTNITYTFSRSGDFSQPLSVAYSVGGTATPGVDYTGLPSTATTQTITFAAGSSTASVVLDPSVDNLVEANETVALTLQSGTGYSVTTTAAVTSTITNVNPPTVTLTVAPSTVTEGSGSFVYTFSRSVATADPLTVAYAISGTATNGVDYATIPASITIAANATSATLMVSPLADILNGEVNETVELTLSAGSNYLVGTSAPAVGTVVNTVLPAVSLALAPASVFEAVGAPLVFSFSRDGDLSSPLTVTYSLGGTASEGSDYASLGGSGSSRNVSFAANSATATVTVTPYDDSLEEANETVALTLQSGVGYGIANPAAVVGTINNDDIAPVLAFSSTSTETLTGSSSLTDTFQLSSLSMGLMVMSSNGAASFDRITNLEAGLDRIDTPSTRTTALNPKLLGSVSALNSIGIGALLTTKNFSKGGAATFTYLDTITTPGTALTRTFLALNDATAGFNASSDAVLEITGYSGTLGGLAIF